MLSSPRYKLTSEEIRNNEEKLRKYSEEVNVDVVRQLLSKGVDINCQVKYSSFWGYGTPLNLAVINRQQDVVKILLEAGADPSIENETFTSTPLSPLSLMVKLI